jgi:pimeloyl-ACP methyl ester carboxylesterase
MSTLADVLWLDTSLSLRCFNQPLLEYLSETVIVQEWKHHQDKDKPSCLDTAVLALHDYLKYQNKKLHLVGHSTAGLLALLYTCRYPEKVQSLTLLAVGGDSAVNWQAHYYEHLQFKSRSSILNAMVYNLFGYQDKYTIKKLESIFEQDLDCSLSPHSLYKKLSLRPTSVPVPLMICGSLDDIIVEPDAVRAWQHYLKQGDHLCLCTEGKHFFHFFHPEFVGTQILDFWKSDDLQGQSKVLCQNALLK